MPRKGVGVFIVNVFAARANGRAAAWSCPGRAADESLEWSSVVFAAGKKEQRRNTGIVKERRMSRGRLSANLRAYRPKVA